MGKKESEQVLEKVDLRRVREWWVLSKRKKNRDSFLRSFLFTRESNLSETAGLQVYSLPKISMASPPLHSVWALEESQTQGIPGAEPMPQFCFFHSPPLADAACLSLFYDKNSVTRLPSNFQLLDFPPWKEREEAHIGLVDQAQPSLDSPHRQAPIQLWTAISPAHAIRVHHSSAMKHPDTSASVSAARNENY